VLVSVEGASLEVLKHIVNLNQKAPKASLPISLWPDSDDEGEDDDDDDRDDGEETLKVEDQRVDSKGWHPDSTIDLLWDF
jgi:hypothetical protein